MWCPNCGQKNAVDAAQCRFCAFKFAQDEPPTLKTPSVVPTAPATTGTATPSNPLPPNFTITYLDNPPPRPTTGGRQGSGSTQPLVVGLSIAGVVILAVVSLGVLLSRQSTPNSPPLASHTTPTAQITFAPTRTPNPHATTLPSPTPTQPLILPPAPTNTTVPLPATTPTLAPHPTATSLPIATATPLPTATPMPRWLDADIGNPGMAGTSQTAALPFSVSGGGSDIWGTADSFHYTYQPMTGNEQIVAEVTAQQNTNGWAKSGVMIRDGLGASATYALQFVTPASGVDFQNRTATNAGTGWTSQLAGSVPYWVKLVRVGNTISGFASTDGVNWTATSSMQVAFTDTPEIGLAVTAHDNGQLNTSTFDHVVIGLAS